MRFQQPRRIDMPLLNRPTQPIALSQTEEILIAGQVRILRDALMWYAQNPDGDKGEKANIALSVAYPCETGR